MNGILKTLVHCLPKNLELVNTCQFTCICDLCHKYKTKILRNILSMQAYIHVSDYSFLIKNLNITQIINMSEQTHLINFLSLLVQLLR